MQEEIKKLIKEIAERNGISYDVCKAIFESQFYCAKTKIKTAIAGKPETFPKIRFRYLGSLVPRENQILKIHETATSSDSGNKSN